jgi:hypothetical protein
MQLASVFTLLYKPCIPLEGVGLDGVFRADIVPVRRDLVFDCLSCRLTARTLRSLIRLDAQSEDLGTEVDGAGAANGEPG